MLKDKLKNTKDKKKSLSKRKISPKSQTFSEDTQFPVKGKHYFKSGDEEPTINFALDPSILEKYHEEIKASRFESRLSHEQNLINQILNRGSLKTRYGDLLKNEGDFLLPMKFKQLLNQFTAIDQFISANKDSRVEFREVQENLKKKGMALSLKDLGQILSLDDKLFNVFTRNKKTLIEIPRSDEDEDDQNQRLEERLLKFREEMLNLLKNHHMDFLNSKNETQDYLMYESQRVWHPEFPLEEIPNIPIKDLRRLVQNENYTRVPNKGRNKLSTDRSWATYSGKERTSKKKAKTLTFEQKLREKVQREHQAFEKRNDPIKLNFKFELNTMKMLVKMIQEYFNIRGVSNMFAINVFKHIANNPSFLFLKEKEVQLYIEEIVSLCPDWLHFAENTISPILQIDKSFSLESIYKDIEAFFP